jgi:hypothetical protein
MKLGFGMFEFMTLGFSLWIKLYFRKTQVSERGISYLFEHERVDAQQRRVSTETQMSPHSDCKPAQLPATIDAHLQNHLGLFDIGDPLVVLTF